MKPILWVLGVGIVFLAIFVPLAMHSLQGNGESQDIYRMRQIFVAEALYEQENDNQMAPNLLALRRELSDDSMFLASGDPGSPGPFPLEPTLPSWAPRSPIRISYAYLGSYLSASRVEIPDLDAARKDPLQGLLACPWYTPSSLIVRVNMDGAVTRVQSSGPLNADALFKRR